MYIYVYGGLINMNNINIYVCVYIIYTAVSPLQVDARMLLGQPRRRNIAADPNRCVRSAHSFPDLFRSAQICIYL